MPGGSIAWTERPIYSLPLMSMKSRTSLGLKQQQYFLACEDRRRPVHEISYEISKGGTAPSADGDRIGM